MSLQNSLYYLISDSAVYTIRFDSSHPIFAGHFPGHPIVPGACLVQIAEELAAKMIGHPIRFTALHNLKFRQPITPDQEVEFVFQLINQSLHIQFSVNTITCAQFTATYMCLDSDVQ